VGEERAAIGRAPPPLDVQGCRGETPCQLSITRLTSALLLLARKVGASAIGHGGGTAGCNPGRLARGTATDCLLPRPPALTFGVHGLGPGTHARPLGIITPIPRPPTIPRRTGRVDVRNRLDQGTPCRIDGPSPRIYSRFLRIDDTLPMPYALYLGLQEETSQEIIRLLMCRRVCLKAGANTGRKRAVIIRNLHITVPFHSTNGDRGRRPIGDTSGTNCDWGRKTINETSAARSSPPLIDGSTPKPHVLPHELQ
jgi:hypothetical protein